MCVSFFDTNLCRRILKVVFITKSKGEKTAVAEILGGVHGRRRTDGDVVEESLCRRPH